MLRMIKSDKVPHLMVPHDRLRALGDAVSEI